MSDDGLGVQVIKELQKKEWPENILILEAGTASLYYMEEISRSLHLIAIDAIHAQGQPGDIYRIDMEDIELNQGSQYDAHGFSLSAIIKLAQEITGLPQNAVIYGVEPFDLSLGCRLSQPVKDALPGLIAAVTKEIENLEPKL